MKGVVKALKLDTRRILYLTSQLRLLKLIELEDGDDHLVVTVTPGLSDKRMRAVLRNRKLLNKLRDAKKLAVSASVLAYDRYGGTLETISRLLPDENRTVYLDPVKLQVLRKLAEEIDIEEYTKWFIINKLPRMRVFNISAFVHNDIIAKYRSSVRGD